jgi:hypothetical protein
MNFLRFFLSNIQFRIVKEAKIIHKNNSDSSPQDLFTMTASPTQQNKKDRMVTSHVFEFHQSKKKGFSSVKVLMKFFMPSSGIILFLTFPADF